MPGPSPGPSSSRARRVVVLGCGFGGLPVARRVAGSGVDLTLVDRQNHHLFQPLLYQVATAALSPADIAAPIRSIVKAHPGTRVLLDEVEGVDRTERLVKLASGAEVEFDTLVIATGARHSYFGADQWAAFAPGLKTLDDATRIRRRVLLALEKAETLRAEHAAERAMLVTFVIVGGGPTGVEKAGAVAELTQHAADMDFRFVDRDCIRVVLLEAGERLLPGFPPSLSQKAEAALKSLGVVVQVNSPVTDVGDYGVTAGGERIDAAVTIWAAGVQASPAAQWLGVEPDRSGRVTVGPDLALPDDPDIFVIGDTARVVDRRGQPVPGVAPAAKQQGEFVARTILARLKGRHPPGRFRYRDWGNLATIGRKRAVADFGWLRLWGGPAWLLWCTAHIYFLVGFRNRLVVSANWLWNYVTYDRGARLITGIRREAPPDARPSLGPT
jgi:NADH dehydrogenase FAD-containing subunit